MSAKMLWCLCFVFLLILQSCSEKTPDPADPTELEFWIGTYNIDTIGGEAVDCDVIYLQEELITISNDFRYSVLSLCTDAILTEGDFEFNEGIFQLYVDWVVQEPIDEPEFELQIFQDEEGRIRMYRCSPSTGSCTLRLGTRIE